MSTVFLSAAQSQLLDHVMAWGNLRIGEVTGDPFASPAAPRGRESTQSLMLPSLKVTRYLDRVKSSEAQLMTALGIDVADFERELSKPDGAPSLSNYLWMRRPAWLVGGVSDKARIAMDDLSQIRLARINTLDRVMRWKRNFGAHETMASRPNVAGFQNNLTWLQETYATRHSFASALVQRSQHGWNLVEAFYDPAVRAAQNMMDSALALRHYHKVVPPT